MLIPSKLSQAHKGLLLTINTNSLLEVSESKLLGFRFKNDLLWTTDIASVKNKITSSLKLLYSIRNLIDKTTSRHFYYNFIHPHLILGIALYYLFYYPLSNKRNLDNLFKTQKKRVRAIRNVTLKD